MHIQMYVYTYPAMVTNKTKPRKAGRSSSRPGSAGSTTRPGSARGVLGVERGLGIGVLGLEFGIAICVYIYIYIYI